MRFDARILLRCRRTSDMTESSTLTMLASRSSMPPLCLIVAGVQEEARADLAGLSASATIQQENESKLNLVDSGPTFLASGTDMAVVSFDTKSNYAMNI